MAGAPSPGTAGHPHLASRRRARLLLRDHKIELRAAVQARHPFRQRPAQVLIACLDGVQVALADVEQARRLLEREAALLADLPASTRHSLAPRAAFGRLPE